MAAWTASDPWVPAEPWPGHDGVIVPLVRGDGTARVYARTLSTSTVTVRTRGESSVR